MNLPFFTIGHSTRELGDFIALLRGAEIGLVADVRKMPRSRVNPQFNADTLPEALEDCDISYEHIAALGGLRGKARTVPESVNGHWTNESFHNYADYALSKPFRAALDHLIAEGRKRRCVLMCSEAVWWRCHRRIIADYLLARGESVFHIFGQERLEPARLTPGAVAQLDGVVVYPESESKSGV